MNNEEKQVENENFEQQIVIDKEKLNRIIERIIKLENYNVNTRELNDEDMKKKIRKIIEEEIKCC